MSLGLDHDTAVMARGISVTTYLNGKTRTRRLSARETVGRSELLSFFCRTRRVVGVKLDTMTR